MKVKRIVANVDTQDVAAAKRFYHDLLGLDVLMDHGWIATYGSAHALRLLFVRPVREEFAMQPLGFICAACGEL